MNFFNILIPLLFLSTSVYAEDTPKIPFMASPDITQSSPQKNEPKKIFKCQLNVKEYLDALSTAGYEPLMTFWDEDKTYISRQIFYSPEHNDLAIISLVYDKINFDPTKTPIKVCREFAGNKIAYEGPTFKKFVLHQIIEERQDELNNDEKTKQKYRKKESEPYQGNPWEADDLISPTNQ